MKTLKNKVLSYVLVFTMCVPFLLGITPVFAANNTETVWNFNEDFSSYTTNAEADSITLTAGKSMILENDDKTNKYMQVSASNGNITFSQTFTNESSINNLKFSIDAGFVGGLTDATINLTSASGNFAILKIGGDKSIKAYDGKIIGTLSSKILTTILVAFNTEHSRYSVYVNDKLIAYDYYIDVATPKTFTGYSVTGSVTTETKFYVDEVYAYNADKIVSKNNYPKTYYSEAFEEVKEYEDIIIPDRTVTTYENFEPDPREYHELVKEFNVWTYPYDKIIEVRQDEDSGNRYLAFEGGNGGQTFFATISASGQQSVIEFDVYTPTLSRLNCIMYDTDRNNIGILESDTNLRLLSNKKTVGYLDAKKWVRIAIVIDNNAKTVNVYVNGEHTGVDVPMTSDKLNNLSSMRFYGGRDYDNNLIYIDNVVSYTGTELYDYSKLFRDEIDYGNTVYEHNTQGVYQFLEKYNAIHTVTGKLYVDSMDKVTKMPYWENGILYVARVDAEKLVFGSAKSNSDEFVDLKDFANKNGKQLTTNKTNTILVGDKEAVISDTMIKDVNAFMTYDRPSREQLMESFNNVHPRITINQQWIDKFKEEYKTNERVKKWVNLFIRDAENYLKVDPQVFVEMNDSDGRMLVPAKTIRERVQKLALSYYITGKKEYVERAWLEIENACNYPHWHQGYHELDSSMLCSAIGYGYDWFYHEWTDHQKKIMEDALCRHQLDQAQEVYHAIRPYGWAAQDNNWNPHCNGDTSLGAIAIFETNPEKYADIISSAIKCLDYAVIDFYPDGAWKEGVGYWNGTVEPLTEFCNSLETAFGSSFNIENTACFDITCDYIIGNAGPTGANNYNDSPTDVECSQPPFMWFASKFNNPTYAITRLKELDLGVAPLGVLDLIFYDSSIDLSNAEEKLDYYFSDLELVAMKSANGDPNAAYVSFHSGNNLNADAHSHIDSGTFVLDMLGERYVVDPGSHYYYTEGHGLCPNKQPTPDSISRWNYYQHTPEGHSTFIINPDNTTMGQHIITNDKMETVVSKERGAYAITSLNSAYKGFARKVRRGAMLGDDRRSVTIRDEIKLNDGNNDIYWFMQVPITTKFDFIDNNTFVMDSNGKKVKVMVLTNADKYEMSLGECTQLFLEPAPEQIPIKTLQRFEMKLQAKGDVYIQYKFIPLDDPYANIAPENIPLDSWSIPDGAIQKLPEFKNVYINGEKAELFNPESSVNVLPVDVELKEIPTLTWDISDEFDAEVTQSATALDGTSIIRVWRKDNPDLYRIYQITFNPYDIEGLEPYRIIPVAAEANDIPQQENGPNNTFDKDVATYWAASGKDKVLISDLGEVKLIDFIGIAFKSGDARKAKYQLFISEDKENWEMIFDGESSGTTTDIELSPKIGKNARYIKFVGFGNNSSEWNSIGEFCAYKLPY